MKSPTPAPSFNDHLFGHQCCSVLQYPGNKLPRRADRIRPLVLCGPSGTGKTTLVKKLMDEFEHSFGFSTSRKQLLWISFRLWINRFVNWAINFLTQFDQTPLAILVKVNRMEKTITLWLAKKWKWPSPKVILLKRPYFPETCMAPGKLNENDYYLTTRLTRTATFSWLQQKSRERSARRWTHLHSRCRHQRSAKFAHDRPKTALCVYQAAIARSAGKSIARSRHRNRRKYR